MNEPLCAICGLPLEETDEHVHTDYRDGKVHEDCCKVAGRCAEPKHISWRASDHA